ncbi:MAG: UvrB/UvrC motif-containing protein [Akkermansia sp.]|nr:UvrB/UvrC motif-containing protein [Akkermansia sp.]
MKKCQICGKRATMLLTQIVNGQVSDLALCESCARAKGLFDPQSLTFAEKFFPEEFKAKVDKLVRELAEGKRDEKPSTRKTDVLTKCPVCDFPLETYRKTGRLGCPDCYTIFSRELDISAAPESKAPQPGTSETAPDRNTLEKRLQDAITREDYELAARLRDQLKSLH